MHVPKEEYASFYGGYIENAASFSILDGLKKSMQDLVSFCDDFPNDRWEYRYAMGKWTPKEILLHLIDTERVFTYRAMTLVRSSNAVLESFDQDEFVDNSKANARTVSSLRVEFDSVRSATVSFFQTLDEEDVLRSGQVSGGLMSVRALGKIITGHTLHHLRILEERYR